MTKNTTRFLDMLYNQKHVFCQLQQYCIMVYQNLPLFSFVPFLHCFIGDKYLTPCRQSILIIKTIIRSVHSNKAVTAKSRFALCLNDSSLLGKMRCRMSYMSWYSKLSYYHNSLCVVTL